MAIEGGLSALSAVSAFANRIGVTMSDDYRDTLNEYLQHADVAVELRPVKPGDVPRLNVDAPLCTDSVLALLIGGVRELARLAKAEPGVLPFARGVLEELPFEFDHEMGLPPPSSKR